MNSNYYTIGHSNYSIDKFIEYLKLNKIKLVVDVRSLPGSNKNPHFNKENLSVSLKVNKIKYKHIKKLGGLRKASKEIDSNINTFWNNKSFRNYADYAYSDLEFIEGLNELIKLGEKQKTAIMCAEVLWWRCHRRIITDYLISYKKEVYHIIGNKTEKAFISKNAIFKNNKINYK